MEKRYYRAEITDDLIEAVMQDLEEAGFFDDEPEEEEKKEPTEK